MSDFISGDELDGEEKARLIKERDRAEKMHNLKLDLVLFERWRQDRVNDNSVRTDTVPEVLVQRYMKAMQCEHSLNIKGVHYTCVETIIGHEIHRNPEALAIWSGPEITPEDYASSVERQNWDIRKAGRREG